MANQSTTGFGLRPIAKIGQNDNNAGLSEWLVASGSAAMYHNDMVMLTGDGVILRSSDSSSNNIGSLNGVFYTDPTTSKPTWSNYMPSVAASDIVAFINSDPQQIFEIRNATSTLAAADVGGTTKIVLGAGATPNWVSTSTVYDAPGTSADQFKLIGISRDPDNQDAGSNGCIWRVQVYEHILANICAAGV